MQSAPCKGCSDRCQYCHGRCEKYRAWVDARRTELELRRVMSETDEVQITSYYKVKRKRRDRK